VFPPSRLRAEGGQASAEWVGLILVVALLIAGLLALIAPLPLGAPLARALAAKLICAVDLSDSCQAESELVAAYGADLAAEVRDHAPTIVYERGMQAIPVDYRSCRSASCADAASGETVWRSASGESATTFVHVIDCRGDGPPPLAGSSLAPNCSGGRAGNLYLQYWLYYPESATLRGVPGAGGRGYHRDDWEGYHVRIGPHGDASARASSHRGYNYQQSVGNWGSDAAIGPLRSAAEAVGARNHNGWGPETGLVFVSGGSHAGNAKANPLRYSHLTPAGQLALVPLEPAAAGGQQTPRFAISAPWLKLAWRDPEAEETS
jgi:hypothetical protein